MKKPNLNVSWLDFENALKKYIYSFAFWMFEYCTRAMFKWMSSNLKPVDEGCWLHRPHLNMVWGKCYRKKAVFFVILASDHFGTNNSLNCGMCHTVIHVFFIFKTKKYLSEGSSDVIHVTKYQMLQIDKCYKVTNVALC